MFGDFCLVDVLCGFLCGFSCMCLVFFFKYRLVAEREGTSTAFR